MYFKNVPKNVDFNKYKILESDDKGDEKRIN